MAGDLMGELVRLDAIAGGRALLFCEFELEGEPVPKARARVGKGRGYTPSRTVAAQLDLAKMMLAYRKGPIARYADVRVELEFHAGNDQRRDVDNLAKLVLDAGIGVVYVDDSQVEQLEVMRYRNSTRPRTVVRVYRLGDDDA